MRDASMAKTSNTEEQSKTEAHLGETLALIWRQLMKLNPVTSASSFPRVGDFDPKEEPLAGPHVQVNLLDSRCL